ncbi:MAG: cob(I)yrinic acid a,c-diamide adenosyltransferase [Xanthomonadaceae bacterium]|nr:cob(I)yrinic acid a,c-diamide adenosyltransferase [Xanthomonadaceae bacterium]
MKIYTKGGDKGETGLFGGARVPKNDLRIEAYGTLDELNAVLGVLLSDSVLDAKVRARLLRTQGELFQIGAELATPPNKKVSTKLIASDEISKLENEIDEMEKTLSPLKTFILPGGAKLSAKAHFARTVCRRAERAIVTLREREEVRDEVITYTNRLSDYLFVTARFLNAVSGESDVPWLAP